MKTNVILSFVLLWALWSTAQEEVLNYEELQKFLPAQIPGYDAGSPDGQTTTMQGMSFSSASIEYTTTEDAYIRITLLDYAGAMNMYQAATATWAAGMTFENDEVFVKQVDWSDQITGWEQYHKDDKTSYLALGISERFFLTLEANQQEDTRLVNEIAKKMDLDQLASK